MSDTPRTAAVLATLPGLPPSIRYDTLVAHADALERENRELLEALKALRDDFGHASMDKANAVIAKAENK